MIRTLLLLSLMLMPGLAAAEQAVVLSPAEMTAEQAEELRGALAAQLSAWQVDVVVGEGDGVAELWLDGARFGILAPALSDQPILRDVPDSGEGWPARCEVLATVARSVLEPVLAGTLPAPVDEEDEGVAPVVVPGPADGDITVSPPRRGPGAQHDEPSVDVLWVLDDTASMADEQAGLAANLGSFLDLVEPHGFDLHLGVITTGDPILRGPMPVMTSSTPDLDTDFAEACDVGTAGTALNQGLQHAADALTHPLASHGGSNYGFMREEARLVVVFVTDSEDGSSSTVTAYVTILQNLKLSPDDTRLVTASGQMTGCSTAYGSADPAQRYEQASSTSSGVSASICAETWMQDLDALPWEDLAWRDTWVLPHEPLVHTINVEVGGVVQTSGWHIGEVLNAIVFDEDSIPPSGAEVIISFIPYASC